MKRAKAGLFIAIVAAVMFGLLSPAFALQIEIEITSPPHAELGATSDVGVKLTERDSNSPVAEAEVVLYQTTDFGGQSGKVRVAHATTDEDGVAHLRWVERSSGSKDFTVEYFGPGESTPEIAEIHVSEGTQLYRSQEGLKLPGIGVSSIIGLLVIIWGTLLLAASLVFAVVRAGSDDPSTNWTVEAGVPSQRRFAFPVVVALFVVSLGATLLVVVVRNPQTHGNLAAPDGYSRTPVAYLGQVEHFPGFSLADPETTNGPDAVEDGRAVYIAHGCAACHGLDADGGVVGSSLRNHSTDALEAAARFGPLGMPAFNEENLSRSAIEKIAALVASFESAIPSVEVRGDEVFSQFCASCHGVDAEGDIGPALAGTELSSEEIVSVVTTGGERMPSWRGTMSEEQMQVVAAYVKGLGASPSAADAPNDPSEHLFSENCSGCHGAGGTGGFAPQLAGTALSADELGSIISNGRGGMPPFADLADEQIEALVGYILTLEP
jgi:mono/diheme cytochrome c family protein